MMSSKPTFVLFPGAFHTTAAFTALKNLLEQESYQCILSESLGSSDPDISLATDVGFFRNQVILPLIESGKELVLVFHSYAGASAGGAVQGLAISDRSKHGFEGGVLGLICITALCLPNGLSIQDALQMSDELAEWSSVDMDKGLVSVKSQEHAIKQFYSQLPIAEAEIWANALKTQTLATFKSKAEYSPWVDPAWEGRLAYLLCEKDPTFPLQLQEHFVQSGKFGFVESLPNSHSPFLESPKDTADVLVKFAKSFIG